MKILATCLSSLLLVAWSADVEPTIVGDWVGHNRIVTRADGFTMTLSELESSYLADGTWHLNMRVTYETTRRRSDTYEFELSSVGEWEIDGDRLEERMGNISIQSDEPTRSSRRISRELQRMFENVRVTHSEILSLTDEELSVRTVGGGMNIDYTRQ